LKNAPCFKEHPIFLIALLLTCTVFFASCIGDTSNNSSPTTPASNAQTSAITPIGAQATCFTLYTPSLVKLADGNYEMMDEIDNCGGKDAGPLKITTQIDTETTKQRPDLLGPATLPAHGKALYHTFRGQTGGTNKELQFRSPSSPSAVVTILVTINGALQGEWDGQVTIPA
jgi:hypothetical protein